MAPRTKPANLQDISGLSRPDRPRVELFNPLQGEPVKPDWLKGRASKIWDSRVEKYRARGMKVRGNEDVLAQYCALEADLIDQFWRKQITPPMAMVNAHRLYAHEFFDTPASQHVTLKGGLKDNPFTEHKRT